MKQVVISPSKANSLYWLGRYTERVYLELHLLRKCFDMMIDGDPVDSQQFLHRIGNCVDYKDQQAVINGLVHDKNNPVSVISCIERANDNAVLLRDEIMTPTLGYIQMSLEHIRKCCRESVETNAEELQCLTDWSLAFWGSLEERVYDPRVKTLLHIGKLVEHIDMNMRFAYKFYRIEEAFASLERCKKEIPMAFDEKTFSQLAAVLTEDAYSPENPDYLSTVLRLLGSVVTL